MSNIKQAVTADVALMLIAMTICAVLYTLGQNEMAYRFLGAASAMLGVIAYRKKQVFNGVMVVIILTFIANMAHPFP